MGKLPSHLFASDDGALYDTRVKHWHVMPLRPVYRKTFARIETVAQFKATLRAGEFTFPGMYPLYFITSDGAALSFESARKESRSVMQSIRENLSDGWRIVAVEVNYEDAELLCDHSGKRIPSAYGDDSEEEGEAAL